MIVILLALIVMPSTPASIGETNGSSTTRTETLNGASLMRGRWLNFLFIIDDMNETGCRKGLFDMWLKTYKEDSDYEVIDGGNGCYIVKTRNFGKERYGVLYISRPYRNKDSDDIFWYDIEIHSVSKLGVHFMSYGEIVNRCKSYYDN